MKVRERKRERERERERERGGERGGVGVCAYFVADAHDIKWSRGVTVSTLDSESSDRGSNPRET